MLSTTKHKDNKHFCMHCLQNGTTKEVLSNHKKQFLLIHGCQAVNYESETIKFINHNKQIPIPFKVYADTECFFKRTNSYEGEYTMKYQEHFPNSISTKLVCIDDRFNLPFIVFKGRNCVNEFIAWVLKKYKWTKQITKQYFNKGLIMTNEEICNNSNICHIYKEELNTDKVRDHCRVTVKFIGVSHNKCNLNLRLPKKLPNIVHNLQGYEGHLIVKELNNFELDLDVNPKGIDNYISIIVNRHITFIDSLQFLKASLKTLTSNLEDNDFKYLMSEFSSDKLEILKRKDAYPYEWVDSYEKFNYPQLPPKKCFYSSLKNSKSDKSYGHISNEQYLHLQNVWNAFNFNTFENFQSLLKERCNIILADVFEISTFLNFYELDPCFILVHLVYHWTLC